MSRAGGNANLDHRWKWTKRGDEVLGISNWNFEIYVCAMCEIKTKTMKVCLLPS